MEIKGYKNRKAATTRIAGLKTALKQRSLSVAKHTSQGVLDEGLRVDSSLFGKRLAHDQMKNISCLFESASPSSCNITWSWANPEKRRTSKRVLARHTLMLDDIENRIVTLQK